MNRKLAKKMNESIEEFFKTLEEFQIYDKYGEDNPSLRLKKEGKRT